jgi:hypothetical protein
MRACDRATVTRTCMHAHTDTHTHTHTHIAFQWSPISVISYSCVIQMSLIFEGGIAIPTKSSRWWALFLSSNSTSIFLCIMILKKCTWNTSVHRWGQMQMKYPHQWKYTIYKLWLHLTSALLLCTQLASQLGTQLHMSWRLPALAGKISQGSAKLCWSPIWPSAKIIEPYVLLHKVHMLI